MSASALDQQTLDELLERARRVRENAYAPYSNYRVGAALLCADGEIFEGCNVENASLGMTICAERNAVAQAIACGHSRFLAMVIVTDDEKPATPCGACRQVLGEFAKDLTVVVANLSGRIIQYQLSDLIPYPFSGGA
jgi:cytidine deaminase